MDRIAFRTQSVIHDGVFFAIFTKKRYIIDGQKWTKIIIKHIHGRDSKGLKHVANLLM